MKLSEIVDTLTKEGFNQITQADYTLGKEVWVLQKVTITSGRDGDGDWAVSGGFLSYINDERINKYANTYQFTMNTPKSIEMSEFLIYEGRQVIVAHIEGRQICIIDRIDPDKSFSIDENCLLRVVDASTLTRDSGVKISYPDLPVRQPVETKPPVIDPIEF